MGKVRVSLGLSEALLWPVVRKAMEWNFHHFQTLPHNPTPFHVWLLESEEEWNAEEMETLSSLGVSGG